MPLCRRLVEDLALGKGEAVMHTWIDLELTGATRPHKQRAQLCHHRRRRQVVELGASNIKFTLDLAECKMRTFNGIADEPGAVEGGRCRDALGVACGSRERVRSTHAVAMDADRS